MKVSVDRTFEKDISSINDQKLLDRVADMIEYIEGCNSLGCNSKPEKIERGKRLL